MVNNKDKWSALSMSERADLIKLYVGNGITSLAVMREDYNGVPYSSFNSSEYDYFNAHPSNAPTEKGDHWTSRNPKTGQLLKREDHPTFDLMIEGEKQAGYNIVKGLDGNLYSVPNEPNNYVENYNSFGGGGNTNTSNTNNSAYISGRESLMPEEPKAQRDNTRAYQISDNAFMPRDAAMRDDVLLSDGITGFIPFVGDALQLADAVNDVNNKNYGRAALTAGLMLLPNIIEKPVKAVSKPLKRFITHGIDSDNFIISMRNWKGSPMPSMAVNDVDLPLFDYGNMTFIGSDDMLDNSIIFKGDGSTPTIATVDGDYIDDVQEIMRRMKAQQNTDEYNIGKVISKKDASTLPISGEGTEKYFEAKYQDFIPWDKFKHLVTYGKLDPDFLRVIEELKIPHTNVSAEDYLDTIKRIAAEEGLLFKEGGKINTFSTGGGTETLLQTPQINPKNPFSLFNMQQQNPLQQFQAAIEELENDYSYEGMPEDLKNAWMQADEDYKSFSKKVKELEKYGSKDKDTSETITITAPNTDISKFIFNNKISKDALSEIQRVAELRNQDPYDILAHMLIEASGSTIDTNRSFNTHNVIRNQINNSVLDYFKNDRLKQVKQFGIYKDGKTDYTAEEILKAASRMNERRNNALENVVVPESYIDAVALYMLLSGRDFNPAQESLEVVNNSYLDMVDSAIMSLKENMPDLFK